MSDYTTETDQKKRVFCIFPSAIRKMILGSIPVTPGGKQLFRSKDGTAAEHGQNNTRRIGKSRFFMF